MHITVCTRLTSCEVFDLLSNPIALILYKHRNAPRNDGLVGDSHLFGTIQLGLFNIGWDGMIWTLAVPEPVAKTATLQHQTMFLSKSPASSGMIWRQWRPVHGGGCFLMAGGSPSLHRVSVLEWSSITNLGSLHILLLNLITLDVCWNIWTQICVHLCPCQALLVDVKHCWTLTSLRSAVNSLLCNTVAGDPRNGCRLDTVLACLHQGDVWLCLDDVLLLRANIMTGALRICVISITRWWDFSLRLMFWRRCTKAPTRHHRGILIMFDSFFTSGFTKQWGQDLWCFSCRHWSLWCWMVRVAQTGSMISMLTS